MAIARHQELKSKVELNLPEADRTRQLRIDELCVWGPIRLMLFKMLERGGSCYSWMRSIRSCPLSIPLAQLRKRPGTLNRAGAGFGSGSRTGGSEGDGFGEWSEA